MVILKFTGVTDFVDFIATIKHSIECIDKPAFTLIGKFSDHEIDAARMSFSAVVTAAPASNNY